MKITKKQPLRPRGRSEEKRQSTKNAIRDAYINGPQKEVQIIPAKRDMEAETEKKKLRVCAYCRVSTDEDTQASSYELQVQNYTRMIQENPEWEFAGIFADEGISGTSVLHREHFLEMIEKCKAGEIDLIITKQVSRFARNVLDSLNYIFMLRKLDPPVGVYFETEKLNTLDKSSDMVITVLSLVAQSESEQKSNSLKWSFKRRRAQGLGIYPSWALLGYRLDDEKSWEIVEDEADIVRTIYSLYLDGYSSTQIAELLTKSGIPTVKGLSVWSSGSVLGILKNEKYCGDALCQKTVTIDFFTHKSVKNNGIEPQYETAITADGQIVADFITSGSLVANIIKAGVIQSQDGSSWWDLESGEVVLRAYATSKEVTEVSDRITTIEEQKMLRLVIISSNGNIFKNGNVKTLLSAKVYSWDEDITDTLDANQFVWTRVSEDTEADKVWNEQHFSGAKSVVITGADVKVRATFYCDLIDTTTRQSLL